MLIALLVLGLCSCNSVNKTRSTEHLKEDSVSVHKSDSAIHSFIDSLVEETKSNSSDKTTIADGENTLNITFDSGYIHTSEPTKVTLKDSAGVKLITSNKPLKSVTETTKQSSTKKDVQNSLAKTKIDYKNSDSGSKSTFDSTNLRKELKTVSTTKVKHSFSLWWLLLLLIPIVYFTLKYYKDKLPSWLAKVLMFV
jgi:hypothetical protein